MSELSTALNAALPDGWKTSDVAKRLEDRVHRATVYNYFRGKHPARPDDEILQALASVIPGASVDRLRAAAKVAPGLPDLWVPPAEAHRLNGPQRAALDRFIVETVRATEGVEPPSSNVTRLRARRAPHTRADDASELRNASRKVPRQPKGNPTVDRAGEDAERGDPGPEDPA